VSLDHLVHPSGDQEQDARRFERIAWLHYQRMARSLAETPITRADKARQRVEVARAEFARAWRALDEVIQ
jgi:hypothetical protein